MEANQYLRHILILQTTRTVKDFIESNNSRFQIDIYAPLPKFVIPTTREGLECSPILLAQTQFQFHVPVCTGWRWR